MLASEPGLVDEIEFDLRRFEKEEQDKRRARVSESAANQLDSWPCEEGGIVGYLLIPENKPNGDRYRYRQRASV